MRIERGFASGLLDRGGRVGFSYSTQKEDADTVAENTVESSRRVERDKFVDLPPHASLLPACRAEG